MKKFFLKILLFVLACTSLVSCNYNNGIGRRWYDVINNTEDTVFYTHVYYYYNASNILSEQKTNTCVEVIDTLLPDIFYPFHFAYTDFDQRVDAKQHSLSLVGNNYSTGTEIPYDENSCSLRYKGNVYNVCAWDEDSFFFIKNYVFSGGDTYNFYLKEFLEKLEARE